MINWNWRQKSIRSRTDLLHMRLYSAGGKACLRRPWTGQAGKEVTTAAGSARRRRRPRGVVEVGDQTLEVVAVQSSAAAMRPRRRRCTRQGPLRPSAAPRRQLFRAPAHRRPVPSCQGGRGERAGSGRRAGGGGRSSAARRR